MLIHIIVSQYKDPLSSGSKKWITTSPLPVFTISRCLINKVAASPYINVGIPGGNRTTLSVLEMVPNHRLSRVLPPSFRSEKKGRRKERRRRTTGFFFPPFDTRLVPSFTKVQKLDRLEKFVLGREVLPRPLGAVILDVWKAAGPQHVVIAAAHRPIEMRHPSLIVHHVGVSHEVRRPRWLVRLNQVASQHLFTRVSIFAFYYYLNRVQLNAISILSNEFSFFFETKRRSI